MSSVSRSKFALRQPTSFWPSDWRPRMLALFTRRVRVRSKLL